MVSTQSKNGVLFTFIAYYCQTHTYIHTYVCAIYTYECYLAFSEYLCMYCFSYFQELCLDASQDLVEDGVMLTYIHTYYTLVVYRVSTTEAETSVLSHEGELIDICFSSSQGFAFQVLVFQKMNFRAD